MGCIWSRDVRCTQCRIRVVNSNIDLCETCQSHLRSVHERPQIAGNSYQYIETSRRICIQQAPRVSTGQQRADRPLFGEYRCLCGREWKSRLSWANCFQVCKNCNRKVRPHKQRPLQPSDRVKDSDKLQEHPKVLCQKCQSLGHYCGKRNNY